MCDCVSSTPLTYNCVRYRKLRHIWCDSKARICRSEYARIHYRPPKVYPPDHKRASNSVIRTTTSTMVTRNLAQLGSKNFELFDEVGVETEGGKIFKFETRREKDGESGIDLSDGEKEVGGGSDPTVSSSVDFLEFEADLDNEKMSENSLRDAKNEDLSQIEGSSRVCSNSKDHGRLVARSSLRGARQIVRRSSMLAKQVISVQSALSLGFISQLWVDTCSWVVRVVEVRPSLLSGEIERFLLEDVFQVGDVVLVKDENVMENELKMVGLHTLVGYSVEMSGRHTIGKVRGYTFNVNSGIVESIELDSFGISIIPSSLVSTYALYVEDVLEVASDTIVVHEAAASHIQRVTKGLWDTQRQGTSKVELREYSEIERSCVQSDHGRNKRRGYGSQKFHPKTREMEDDWELPMDYL